MSAEQLRLFVEALEEAEEADDGDQPELLEQRGAALELGRDWGEGEYGAVSSSDDRPNQARRTMGFGP
jgi:hypothetical protein